MTGAMSPPFDCGPLTDWTSCLAGNISQSQARTGGGRPITARDMQP